MPAWQAGTKGKERNRRAPMGERSLPLRGSAGPGSAAAKDLHCGLEKLVGACLWS